MPHPLPTAENIAIILLNVATSPIHSHTLHMERHFSKYSLHRRRSNTGSGLYTSHGEAFL